MDQLPAIGVTAEVVEADQQFEVVITVRHGIPGCGDTVHVMAFAKAEVHRPEEQAPL